MLTLMRNMLRSKFAGILFLLIIVSMAVWGTEDIFSGGRSGDLISAGDRSLSVRDFDRTLEFFLSRQRDEGGTVLTPEQAVERGVVDQLFAVEASRTANLGYATEIGAVATADAVLSEVRNTPAFQNAVTGTFDLETYQLALNRNRITPQLYERDVTDALTLGYVSGAASAALEPPSVLSRIRAIQLAETRSVSWFTVDADTAGGVTPPTEEDLQAFYDENQSLFAVPELRRANVISLSPDDFVHRVALPEEDILTFYEATKAQRFSAPERRTFTEAVARNEADARILFGELAGGASLAENTDPELVNLNERNALRSELVIEELAAGLFASTARPGTVVGPVEQDGLWIVARVNAIAPGEPFPFEDVRPVIQEELAATEAEGLYLDAVNQLQSLIGAGFTLREIAEETGVPIMRRLAIGEAGLTQQGSPFVGLTDARELVDTIFQTPEGFVTNPVEYRENTTLVAEVETIEPAYTPALEDIRDQVALRYEADAVGKAVGSFADTLKERIETGDVDMAGAAEAAGRDLVRPDRAISRANADVGLPRTALQAVFAANSGDVVTVEGPLPGQVTLVSIDTITAPTEEDIDVLSNAERPRLASALQGDLRAALDAQVRDAIGFEANMAALDAYKAGILTAQ